MPKRYTKFNHMKWPVPDLKLSVNIGRRTMTPAELEWTRAVAGAYYCLVCGSRRYRENVVKKIRGEMPHNAFI